MVLARSTPHPDIPDLADIDPPMLDHEVEVDLADRLPPHELADQDHPQARPSRPAGDLDEGPQAVPAWSRGRAPGPALPRSGAADAAEAVRLARQGAQGQDQAASLLLRQWGARLMRYFMRHGRCSEAVAEELTADAILQFVLGLPPEHVPAEVWLWTLSRHLLIDWARAQASRKRGGADMAWSGRAEITLDDDSMLALLERQAPAHHEDLPAWVRDCVHKAAALMEREEPRHAMVLWMVAQGWSAEEIAIHFGAPPEGVTERQRAAARDRVYRACQTARAHFDHCRE